jgi:hypothetical protein
MAMCAARREMSSIIGLSGSVSIDHPRWERRRCGVVLVAHRRAGDATERCGGLIGGEAGAAERCGRLIGGDAGVTERGGRFIGRLPWNDRSKSWSHVSIGLVAASGVYSRQNILKSVSTHNH